MRCFYFPYLLRFIMLILTWHILAAPLLAQWSTNPTINTTICTAANKQISQSIASDGEGGAIITWQDYRSGNYDIYAQRINANGVVLWTRNGIAISTAANDQTVPRIVSDGEGGAIICWSDFRSSTHADLYAQRINASGATMWPNNGVPIVTAAKIQVHVGIISDGKGGAIISWHDNRKDDYDIYAQRINASGLVLWTIDGNAICTATSKQENPTIISDGEGGAIITWQDYRSGNYDIYAQRINASGSAQWTTNGISICPEANNQVYPTIISNTTGDVIITWFDGRSGDPDIYAQRINLSGTALWTTNGVAISNAPSFQQFPTAVSDGGGGAIITWHDYRSGNFDVYIQRISVNGVVLWTTDGVAISTMLGAQMSPSITHDNMGGAILTWCDQRDDNRDVYVQRINANGTVQWTDNGVAVSIAANDQYDPSIVRDNAGGVIIAWWDNRSGDADDIYAQQVSSNGQLGIVTNVQDDPALRPESFCLEQNYPNPLNSNTTIRFSIPRFSQVTLKVYNLSGQEVATLVNETRQSGHYEVYCDAENLESGSYFYRITAGEFVETKKLILLR